MDIKEYKSKDLPAIANLFYNTVHTINIKDYTREQVYAWATGSIDMEQWDKSMHKHTTLVAWEDNTIIGFGDIDANGFLDRLYVDSKHQGKGIATALCHQLERSVNVERIFTYASITAKPFFEKRGYKVIKKQTIERKGICLTNFLMELHRQKTDKSI
ncbi:MAG: GNAT family N-acetyltransferase [Paludibacter sp.]|nr:GNAT family N-acetyltransferase [Bacteroidales bacterium]MCM1069489.1 GNAT family N-acetyltransferase [Prevotella sp.]MCM1354145.1 GNAT family N-acetyltransferase [Bacteroides sp.]MCM1442998.1 GNAT family N-acetyltransferase [Muribaculum sp.]MCM1482220.1 GNAT family N-acetyltransferase [Paludibacter sp.]